MTAVATQYDGWWIGLSLGFVAVVILVVVVGVILAIASRIADSAQAAAGAVPLIRDQTDSLHDVGRVNEAAISILRSARAARKALTGE